MQDRLYVMQSTYNSNWMIDFLFGADDFTSFFSRLASINDITSYEKELVDELTTQKKNLDTQKATLLNAKASLQSQKNTQLALQEKLVNLKAAQQKEISDNQKESKKVSEAQKKIDAALTELMSQAPSGGGGGGSYVPGSSAVGNAIAQKALSKLGARYWWGANGPTYFDCSGLVFWLTKKPVLKLVVLLLLDILEVEKLYQKVNYNLVMLLHLVMEVVLLILEFILVVEALFMLLVMVLVQFGQYPNQCVKTASLSGYWENHAYNYRRLY